jgi:arginase family enzyme
MPLEERLVTHRKLSACTVSIDIDVVDPSMAPATGTPEIGGLTTREMKKILHGRAPRS